MRRHPRSFDFVRSPNLHRALRRVAVEMKTGKRVQHVWERGLDKDELVRFELLCVSLRGLVRSCDSPDGFRRRTFRFEPGPGSLLAIDPVKDGPFVVDTSELPLTFESQDCA